MAFTVEPDPPPLEEYLAGAFVFEEYTDDFDVGHLAGWDPDAGPALVAFADDGDPATAGTDGADYSPAIYDHAVYDTNVAAWSGRDPSPPLVTFGVDADPPPLDVGGGYSSLFYDPSFYDTTAYTWVVID